MVTTKELLQQVLDRLDKLETAKLSDASAEPDAETLEAQRILREAVLMQAADAAEAEVERNAPVIFIPATLFSFDGDPATDGCEHYAPADWTADDWRNANGLPDDYPAPALSGDRFSCPRLTAEGFVKAGMGVIAA